MLTNQAAVDKHRVHARVVAHGFSTRLLQWGTGVMATRNPAMKNPQNK